MPEPRQFIVTRPGDAGMRITIKAEDFEATQTGVTFYNEPDADVIDFVAFFSHPVTVFTREAVAE